MKALRTTRDVKVVKPDRRERYDWRKSTIVPAGAVFVFKTRTRGPDIAYEELEPLHVDGEWAPYAILHCADPKEGLGAAIVAASVEHKLTTEEWMRAAGMWDHTGAILLELTEGPISVADIKEAWRILKERWETG